MVHLLDTSQYIDVPGGGTCSSCTTGKSRYSSGVINIDIDRNISTYSNNGPKSTFASTEAPYGNGTTGQAQKGPTNRTYPNGRIQRSQGYYDMSRYACTKSAAGVKDSDATPDVEAPDPKAWYVYSNIK